jgi:Tfp pilus assembly protein PilX
VRRHLRRAAADETGAVLLIVLGFIAVIGFLGLALIDYAATNLRVTTALRPVRTAKYSADSAVEAAINKFRQDFTVPCPKTKFYKIAVVGTDGVPVESLVTSQDIVVDCGPQTISGSSRVVTFTARCDSGTPDCPAGKTVLVATVKYDGAPPAVTTTVQSWSVHQ